MKRFLIILVFISLSACRQAEELVFLDSANISAVRRGEKFQNLLIGSPANPYFGDPVLYFKIPEGREFYVGTKLEGELLRLCNKHKRIDASNKIAMGPYPGRKPRSDRPSWGEGAESISIMQDYEAGQHIEIVVRGEEIIGVSIYCTNKKLKEPIEVRVEGSSWHAFPLKKSSLEDLFGGVKKSYRWNVH